MGPEILVPVSLFTAVAAVVIAGFYFQYRSRMAVYDAIRTAIEKTGQVDAALVEAIIRDRVGANADLRRGAILIAVALGFIIFGFMVDHGSFRPLVGLAAFPGLIGTVYVAFHFLAPREPIV